ncbi:hypothetical protein IscW_ISCW002721 [Ixodes scapularis]|uniref:Uncharacterized protein n=1 Tax=Ixodes scapularis TaxID=6945 RepID=B7PCP1_IXOSC|nr:hypothetical protein IscW_ISCW002721 [Ixodes scapularis]|eukprot:XP_002410085.1 hypothetical protein IscW_ISCW002721 [Ixodes scapularis]
MQLVVLSEIRSGSAQTRPHGYKVPRSGRILPNPGRMQEPTGSSAFFVDDNTYLTQVTKIILCNLNVHLSDSEILQRQPWIARTASTSGSFESVKEA